MNLIFFEQTELHSEKNNSFVSFNNADSPQFFSFLPRRDERAVHLLKVLHKKPGNKFDAGVLGGKLGTGTIIEITADLLCVGFTPETDPPLRIPIRLGVGFPRPIQLRRLLRDCSSLGLAAVDLIGTELGEKSYRNTKLLDDGGACAALVEGAIQARDTRLPELTVYHNLAAWLRMDFIRSNLPAAHTGANNTILIAADNVQPEGSFSGHAKILPGIQVICAVGSERGWSDREREQLEQSGFLRLSLGKRALRTETACIAAAVLLMEKMDQLE